MPRLKTFLILVLAIGTSIGVIVLIFKHKKPAPTPVGWTAVVSIKAGNATPAFQDASESGAAGFSDPFGLAIDLSGNLFVTDAGESNRVRKISPEGVVSTFAGSAEGYADGSGSNAKFNTPSGIAIDSSSNLYVADTGNNRIRKISPAGLVTTLAGSGETGHTDGGGSTASFNGPIGVAVDPRGVVFVADTYSDCIRKIEPDGQVITIAGGSGPGLTDGTRDTALFDTPSGIIVSSDQSLIVADTGNNRLRRVSADGQVVTLSFRSNSGEAFEFRRPLGLAATHDGYVYVTELDRSRIIQLSPDGVAREIRTSPANDLYTAPISQMTGVSIAKDGDLYVADSANYLVRKLTRDTMGTDEASRPVSPDPSQAPPERLIPTLTSETLHQQNLLWPFSPQDSPHEVVATMGEVRGSYDSTDGRDHLHSGLDIFGPYGEVARSVRSEKVSSPISNWGFGNLGEGLRVGLISYIHIRVGRDQDDKVFSDPRFIAVNGPDGKVNRIRVKRGIRFRPGDGLGTVNKMYHVHLNVGPPGREINPLSLAPIGFADHIAPTIEKSGIQLIDEAGERLQEKRDGRLIVRGKLRIVVDAYDRADLNSDRRKLGLYRLGYQVLKLDGSAAPGFEQPRITLLFNQLPSDSEAVKLAFADESGITVYGSATTRFLYEITNVVRDGYDRPAVWNAAELPSGDYILRIIAADFSGNEAEADRDLPITVNK
ncbi:MAG TPA: NHL repeat-containing protein [Pyrinomonadaceae bacterium]|nr:NHL repeat-containing protein [Pyrinomonadaceae bacterium]